MRLERDGEVAGELEVAVDPEPLDVRHEALEVLLAEALQLRHLLGEPRQAVLDPVRQRAEREAAVSPAGAEADRARLENDDLAPRIVGLRMESRPQPREPAADDAEVGLARPVERRLGLARRQVVEPERPHDRAGERCPLGLGGRGLRPGEGHGRESTE